MKFKQWLSLFAVLSSILLLAACGSNSGSGGDQSAAPAADDKGTDPTTGIEYVGTEKCIGCHDDISWSTDIVDAYLMGNHVIHSSHISAADEVDGCLDCHDPIGDGPALEAFIDSANIPDGGLAAVGCEACHGAGGDHYGVGPMPNAKPEADACAQCHDKLPDDHLTFHPEADMIATDYFSSAHSDADGRNEAVCVKCHNDEGARKYKDVTTWEGLAATLPIDGTTHAIQCRTCHDPHHAGELLIPEQDSGYPDHILTQSTEYATCTNCHQDADAQLVSLEGKTYAEWEAEMLALEGSSDRAEGDLIYHAARFERVISSTHFDNPLTSYESNDAGTAPSRIEGYVVRAANEHACRDCHNVHSANTELNQQWARSGHGGKILEVKEAADANGHSITGAVDIRLAGVTDDDSPAWNHYDWDAGNRQSCQMCHTTTGAMNFLEDQANYDPANNDFSHLEGWSVADDGTVTSSGQNEMLYCWGCHSNNSGDLRNPGEVTLAYTNLTGANVTLPDMEESNVCYNCHSGRGGMDRFLDGATADPTGAAIRGGTDTHYFASGATIYHTLTNIGYEYPSQDYSDVSYYAHDNLGCAECHMTAETESGDANHTFDVVEKDDTDTIVAIKAENCVACHDGEHALFLADSQVGDTVNLWDGTASVPTTVTEQDATDAAMELEHEAHSYHQAIGALGSVLEEAGTTPTAGYPYFSGSATDQGHGGAMHNWSYLHHEPGGYAHNRYYVKRLLFDSIDWLTAATGEVQAAADRALDGQITLDPTLYPDAIAWLGGDTATGVIAERP